MRRIHRCEGRANRALRLFARRLAAGLLLAWLCPAAAAPAQCAADRIDERASVAYVHDGDTLRLDDGRWVRLVGVDTPELAREGVRTEPEPQAVEARDALRRLLGRGARIGLRIDRERLDRHGRLLAHVYTASGVNVQAWLLAGGYATALRVPPNLLQVECYRAAEGEARTHALGVWALARYQPVEATALPASATGFHLVRGRVERVREGRGSLWLELDGGLSLRIARGDLAYFERPPRDWLHRTVVARGWLAWRGHRPVLRLRHGADIEPAEPSPLSTGLQGLSQSRIIISTLEDLLRS
jgi:endonuclease YncB( thermonuclease family)